MKKHNFLNTEPFIWVSRIKGHLAHRLVAIAIYLIPVPLEKNIKFVSHDRLERKWPQGSAIGLQPFLAGLPTSGQNIM